MRIYILTTLLPAILLLVGAFTLYRSASSFPESPSGLAGQEEMFLARIAQGTIGPDEMREYIVATIRVHQERRQFDEVTQRVQLKVSAYAVIGCIWVLIGGLVLLRGRQSTKDVSQRIQHQ